MGWEGKAPSALSVRSGMSRASSAARLLPPSVVQTVDMTQTGDLQGVCKPRRVNTVGSAYESESVKRGGAREIIMSCVAAAQGEDFRFILVKVE